MNEHKKTSPKDIFLQLLAMVTLYGSAVGVLTLLWQFINVKVPDPLSYSGLEITRFAIRLAVSSLVIVFPVYLWIMRFLENAYAVEPERKEVRIRKWLINFTLFAAELIIMGDLVALVNSFLNGELTTRFLLKVLSVFLVVGAVFWYYYWDMKDKEPASMRMFRWGIISAVGVVVVVAFFFVGSPKQERLRQFDGQRISDLQTVQWQIVNYWQQKGMIPAELSLLEDDISGFRVPRDPETGIVYEYKIIGDLAFALCAGFALESRGDLLEVQPMANGLEDNWPHGSGRACFERYIDPDLYPPRSIKEKPALMSPPMSASTR